MDLAKELPFVSGDEESKEVQELTDVGYVEELRRNFSVWSLGSLCICLMATVRTSLDSILSRRLLCQTDSEIMNSGRHYAVS